MPQLFDTETTGGGRFYLGAPEACWLGRTAVPLFVSRTRLQRVKRWPIPRGPFAVDSGGFTELARNGCWTVTTGEYAHFCRRVLNTLGRPEFIAPQDWMCEPFMLNGRTVEEHQARTVENFCQLRDELGDVVIPVLQGYAPGSYDRCRELYARAGVALHAERLVGVGSVCRRSGTVEANRLLRYLASDGLRLHAFGIKGSTWRACRDVLASADSMAWSYAARCQGRNGNALDEALAWRSRLERAA